MNQAERDRLDALKRANKKLITQKQAAEEIGVTERQLRRLLRKLRRKGDRAVMHALRGRASNRKLPAEMEQRAITVLCDPVYRGFGPTLAAEHLHQRHQITVSKETLRRWMVEARLWRASRRRAVEVHPWRVRRSRWGELIQWDTSDHDWLEGRGEQIYLISMIDDATSRLFARFVRHDSSEENRRLLWAYLERFGRPLAFYTDKAGMFQVAVKTKRQEQREGRDRPDRPDANASVTACQDSAALWLLLWRYVAWGWARIDDRVGDRGIAAGDDAVYASWGVLNDGGWLFLQKLIQFIGDVLQGLRAAL